MSLSNFIEITVRISLGFVEHIDKFNENCYVYDIESINEHDIF